MIILLFPPRSPPRVKFEKTPENKLFNLVVDFVTASVAANAAAVVSPFLYLSVLVGFMK